mgnify:CR=1 FL=1
MKRTTYLVTIEHDEDCAVDRFDIADALRRSPRIDGVSVTETTAVHAKEREVIDAALTYAKARAEYDADDSSGGDFAMVGMLVDAQGVMELRARELRALMEGKA